MHFDYRIYSFFLERSIGGAITSRITPAQLILRAGPPHDSLWLGDIFKQVTYLYRALAVAPSRAKDFAAFFDVLPGAAVQAQLEVVFSNFDAIIAWIGPDDMEVAAIGLGALTKHDATLWGVRR